jgi:hypothetical protein
MVNDGAGAAKAPERERRITRSDDSLDIPIVRGACLKTGYMADGTPSISQAAGVGARQAVRAGAVILPTT